MSNILPKKSWHVYNEDNREKVLKDEEVARASRQRQESLRSQDERKSRINELRRKAGANKVSTKHEVASEKTGHFSLFAEEDALKLKEKEALIQDEQSIRRKNVGSQIVKPPKTWYERIDANPNKLDVVRMSREDPLTLFKKAKRSSFSQSTIKKAKTVHRK